MSWRSVLALRSSAPEARPRLTALRSRCDSFRSSRHETCEVGVKEKILNCIYAAIDDANRERLGDEPLLKAPDTPIHGPKSCLDSLGLVNFVVIVEERLENEFGIEMVLSDDRAMNADPSPFQTVGHLAEHIEVRFKE